MINPNLYPAEVFFSDEDDGYIALARDLPGCSAFGETQEQALAELQDAIEAWQHAAQTAGNPVPEPSKPKADPLPSGKILVRTPRSLHAALIEAAKREGVSLNQHLVSALSASTAAASLIAIFAHHLSEMKQRTSGINATTIISSELFTQISSEFFTPQVSSTAQSGFWQMLNTNVQTETVVTDAPKFLVAASERTRRQKHG